MINLLIIGAGEAAKMVFREIQNDTVLSGKYSVAGFLDDNKEVHEVDGCPVLGNISQAKSVIEKLSIHEALIAIPSAEKDLVDRILKSLSNTNISIRIIPGIQEIIEGNASFRQVRRILPEDLLGREEVGFNLEEISPYYRDKTVFVTGAGGSIGSEIFIQLLELPVKKVVAFGHGENSIHHLIQKVGKDSRFEYVIGDIRDKEKLDWEIKRFQPDIVFHAAAHKHVPLMEEYPDEAVKNNIFGTYNCAMTAIHNHVKRFILVSTDKAVHPTSIMGSTKRIAEKIILSLNHYNKTFFILTRFGNVLGSRGSVIPIFQQQIEMGEAVTVTHPEMTRYFMSIREAARLVIKSGSISEGSIFILDMGKPVKILDIAKEMIRLNGYREDEIPIQFSGIRPGEKLNEEILMEHEKLLKSSYDKLYISKESHVLIEEKNIKNMLDEFDRVLAGMDKEKIKKTIKYYAENE